MAGSVQNALILNAGSSSLKWSLLDPLTEQLEASDDLPFDSAADGRIGVLVKRALDAAGDTRLIGYRVVHGGSMFREATRVDQAVLDRLTSLNELAPLHNPLAIECMVEALRARPSAVHVAAFDTAFHRTIPDVAAVYAIPREWTDRWGIRRFGFHGLSVAYATQQAAHMCQRVPARHVVCHLGAGCSVTAVREGKSIDTSMGFTPLDGVMMATRSGAIDPGIAPFLVRRGFTVDQLNDSLEHLSGLRGVSGVSGDIREVLRQAAAGDKNCTLAYDMFIYSVSRMIGAMVAALGGLDMLTFTGGVGEHQPPLRQRIASQLDYLGVSLDRRLNEATSGDRDIAGDSSRTRVLVIKAREDLSILREIRSFI